MYRKIYLRWLILIFLMILMTLRVYADENDFQGEGTRDNPYLIEDEDDLKKFKIEVNNGEHFDNVYFRQTRNIDLQMQEWEPIGEFGTDNSFDGIYDGDGHYIENLSIVKPGNNGFFGQLGGIVINLGLESGKIEGSCVGGISSHASGSKAEIVNCYSKVDICAVSAK